MSNKDMTEQYEQIAKKIMSKLTDFQRDTVKRIDDLFRKGKKRLLVSDEVGLGKTMIARGTIANFIAWQKREEYKTKEKKPIRIIYICSNVTIAEQNLKKLQITSQVQVEDSKYSRLSMQHLKIFQHELEAQTNDNIQLIPLTPETSFRITLGIGTVAERALIYVILKSLEDFVHYKRRLSNIMKGNKCSDTTWNREIAKYNDLVNECNKNSKQGYLAYMKDKVLFELKVKDNNNLFEKIKNICEQKKVVNQTEKKEIIDQLRKVFAKISLEKLNPNLVILDEFQRFKYLLNSDEETELKMITDKFFKSDNVKILLLSATPYKMYTTLEEIEETKIDEHYSEFIDVMNFLNITTEEKENFNTAWDNYSNKIKTFKSEESDFLKSKNDVEKVLYQNICRTERISEPKNTDLIDTNGVTTIKISKDDIQSFLEIQKLLYSINPSFKVPVDYVKSSPYLLSFMREYQLKKKVEEHFSKNPEKIKNIAQKKLWINKKGINNYKDISYNNARLENLMSYTFKDNAEFLLWVPPSFPYYEFQGKFKNVSHFSKNIIVFFLGNGSTYGGRACFL